MQEQPQIEIPKTSPERGQFTFALLVAAAAAVIVLAALYFWPGRQSPSRGAFATHLPFGPAERAYASNVRIENIALSRAENFLHQEITTLSADFVNAGDRSLRAVEVTIEFSDELNEVILRETSFPLKQVAAPCAPGQRRSFEVSFEHIPPSWNMQVPATRITGLQF